MRQYLYNALINLKRCNPPNINHLENLQQQSKPDMQSKDKSIGDSKLSTLLAHEESTIFPMDLKQVLQLQQFEYTSLDGDSLPPIFVAMTPYMIGKFGKYRKACHFVMWTAGIQSEQGVRDIGLLITLNSNLQPSILGLVLFKNGQVQPPKALENLLKFANQRFEIDNIVLYCNQPETYQQTIDEYNGLYSKRIELQPTFSHKQSLLKDILINHSISKKPYLKKQAFQLINLTLEEKDQKKFYKLIQKFKQLNPDGYNKLLNQPRKFKFVFELPQIFYGFSLLKKYAQLIQNFVKKIQKQKYKSEVHFVNRILQEEYQEMQLKRVPCVDPCSVFQRNSRVQELQHYFEPNPLSEFLENYEKSLSFKQKKIDDSKYTIGGKVGSPFEITKYAENSWACSCGQSIKLGIPCEHLLKVCCLEKLSFENQIDSIYRIGHQKPFLRLD